MPFQEAIWLRPTRRWLVGAEATLHDEPPSVPDGLEWRLDPQLARALAWGLAVGLPASLPGAVRRARRALAPTAGARA